MCSTVAIPNNEITEEILDVADELLIKLNDVLNGKRDNENLSDAIARLSSAYYMCIPYNYPTIPPLIDSPEKLHACFYDIQCIRRNTHN